jgi:hypothetical protein
MSLARCCRWGKFRVCIDTISIEHKVKEFHCSGDNNPVENSILAGRAFSKSGNIIKK